MINNLPNGWREEKFKNVFDFKKKSKIKASEGMKIGTYPFYTSSQKLSKFLDEYVYDLDNALVFGTGGLPSIHYVKNKFATSTDCFTVENNSEDIDTKYIYNFLKGNIYILENGFKGAGLKHISKKYIEDISLPIPPLQQQEKIVKVLDLTSNLIEKQKELLEKYDLFLKSKFIEMFGDPIKNPMGWEVVKLGFYGTLARGKSAHRPRNAPFLYGGKYPFIQTGDITKKGSIYLKNYKQTYSEEGIKQSKLFPKNTIAITIAANIGDTKILSFDCYFPDSVVGFNVERPLFISYLMSFYRYKLEQQATKTAQKNINLQVLNNLDVINPPIELQNKFASIVEKIENIKEKENQKLNKLEDLHNSLMQKAFKGEIE